MKRKIIKIFTLFTFLLLILAVFSTKGVNIENLSKKIKNISSSENNEYDKTEFWALYVASDPYNDEVGKCGIENAKMMKNVLCSNGWQEDHIKLLTGDVTKRDVFQGIN